MDKAERPVATKLENSCSGILSSGCCCYLLVTIGLRRSRWTMVNGQAHLSLKAGVKGRLQDDHVPHIVHERVTIRDNILGDGQNTLSVSIYRIIIVSI